MLKDLNLFTTEELVEELNKRIAPEIDVTAEIIRNGIGKIKKLGYRFVDYSDDEIVNILLKVNHESREIKMDLEF